MSFINAAKAANACLKLMWVKNLGDKTVSVYNTTTAEYQIGMDRQVKNDYLLDGIIPQVMNHNDELYVLADSSLDDDKNTITTYVRIDFFKSYNATPIVEPTPVQSQEKPKPLDYADRYGMTNRRDELAKIVEKATYELACVNKILEFDDKVDAAEDKVDELKELIKQYQDRLEGAIATRDAKLDSLKSIVHNYNALHE